MLHKRKLKNENEEPVPKYTSLLNERTVKMHRYFAGMIAFGIAFSITLLLLVCLAVRKSGEMYVVTLSDGFGAKYVPNAVQSLDSFEPTADIVLTELKEFIENWRAVTLDENIQAKMTESVYQRIAGNAIGYIDDWFEKNNPQEKIGSERVDILVTAMSKVGDSSYMLDFNERVWDTSNNLKSEMNYRCAILTEYRKPRTENQRILNPLGIWIKDIHLSRIRSTTVEIDNSIV